MRNRQLFLLLVNLILLCSCAPKINRNLLRESDLQVNKLEEVHVIGLDENVPMKSQYIGNIKIGEAGFTINCGYDEMILECKKEAKVLGANIVKLIKVKNPDFWSNCYRIEAKLYVNKSPEYKEDVPISIDYSSEERATLELLQGLIQGEFIFYDAEGYIITLFNSTKPFNSKTLKSLKKKFKIDKEDSGLPFDKIAGENLLFKSTEVDESIKTSRSIYIYANTEGTTSVLEFATTLERLDTFETRMLNLIKKNRIPHNIYTKWKVDSIFFANRFIKLGPVCRWQNIRNIQCPYLGQMDWSEFSTEERANQYIAQRIKITAGKSLSEFIDKKKLSVIFERVKTTAEKYTLRIKVPKLLLGGSNILTIYYVVAKIENKYIACVLSHFDNDKNAPNLPPLLDEVMDIR